MKILLISFENEGNKIYRIKKLLEEKGHSCLILEGAESSVNDFVQINKSEYRGLEEPIANFNKKLRRNKCNSDVVKDLQLIEEKYLKGRKIIQLLRTAPIFFDDHHPLKPYNLLPKNNFIRLNYIGEIIFWFIKEIKLFEPDICICIEGNYFLKQLAANLSIDFKYKYYCFTLSRIMDYVIPLNEKLEIHDNANSEINDNKNHALEIYRNLREKLLTYEEFTPEVKLKFMKNYRVNKFIIIKNNCFYFLRNIFNFVKIKASLFKNRIFKNKLFNQKYQIKYFYSSDLKVLIYYLICFIRKTYVELFKNKIFSNKKQIKKNKDNLIKNIVFTLHAVPESSILTFSNHSKEEDLIYYISKLLPVNFNLLVKENKEMIGLREINFYKRISMLGNVILIDPFLNPSETLAMANGVIGNAGTSSLEALIKGIPCALFGYPEFKELVPQKYIGYKGVELFINDLNKNCAEITSEEKIINYISKCICWEIKWPLKEWLSVRDRSYENKNYKEVENSIVKFVDNLTDNK